MKNKSKNCSTGHGTGVIMRTPLSQMIEGSRSIRTRRALRNRAQVKEMRDKEQRTIIERLKASLALSRSIEKEKE